MLLLKPKENLLINHLLIAALYQHNCNCLAGPSNTLIVRTLFVLNSCYIILIEWGYNYFVIYKCTNIIVVIKVLLNMFFIGEWILSFWRVVFRLLYQFFFIYTHKAWEWTRETCAKCCLENKIQIDQIGCDFYSVSDIETTCWNLERRVKGLQVFKNSFRQLLMIFIFDLKWKFFLLLLTVVVQTSWQAMDFLTYEIAGLGDQQ